MREKYIYFFYLSMNILCFLRLNSPNGELHVLGNNYLCTASLSVNKDYEF